jgi:hypothetical protein
MPGDVRNLMMLVVDQRYLVERTWGPSIFIVSELVVKQDCLWEQGEKHKSISQAQVGGVQ